MKAKQISIRLEQHIEIETVQHHRPLPDLSYTTEERETGRYFVIKQMKNATKIEWDNHRTFRVGDKLTADEAEAVARCKVFEVTVDA